MPSSGKRAQRPRREPMMKVDIPDSSPSRPSKRRKKDMRINVGRHSAEAEGQDEGPIIDNGAPQAIAPAPQGYQRPGTPPPASRIKIPGSNKRSPPAYSAGGTMVMNDSESVDLSLDSNAHIKPGYSYSQMIAQAIIGTPGETLVLNGIYQYIMRRYAYYRHQPPHGWQVSY
ncbi:hypothetical protein SS1G_07360 [Sclerotinia sclerotiorum 1980 UF-70]|uniref:Fork-head domain-containing protein n=1 Tax=Sclerotinia sclerotiorum (strain ATCC 18683 / 1980 / Ss-1) TaxID=665079 RepID=A7EPW1_SCLS1|nr:hypothetical protein SS1G_07360 [Sclerotinia sclerotiorum 1980 UF-70]EDO04877.1 hypothetical protein SS1G_07360 [Sclerotinia sclerotiorum 1980 UF-70]